MSDKALKKQLTDVLATVTSNEEIINEVKKDNKMVIELLETIYQRVEDMSKKFDEVLNAGTKVPKTGTATKAKAAKSAPKKKKAAAKSDESKESKDGKAGKPKKTAAPVNNIMAYFKHVYAEDPTDLDDILEENQAKSVFKEHADEIAAKKEGAAREKHKRSLVYKSLSTSQRKKLREKMIEETEANADNEAEVGEESASD
jgi:hypothetical protein